MSPEYPDTPPAATGTGRIKEEILEINREFLRLLTHPCVSGTDGALGLGTGVLTALAALSPREIDRVAAVPLLLAEFRPFPGFDEVRDTPAPLLCMPGHDEAWRTELNDFANRLLTCIWQTSRRDPMLTSLLMGVSRNNVRRLAAFGFGTISRYSVQAAAALQVRLGNHPRFWSDLVGLVRYGSDGQQIASRLALIPLSLSRKLPGVSGPAQNYR